MNSKTKLAGLLPEDLVNKLDLHPSFRGMQIFKALHGGIESFDKLTTLSKTLRSRLVQESVLFSSEITDTLEDQGTTKYQIRLFDGLFIESVLMIDREGRKTLCISSQVGCAMGCRFCKTGTMGLLRSLDAAEIVEQFLLIKNRCGKIDNIVYMGMGEPLHNLESVRKSIELLTHPEGTGLGRRRITVSTCGLISGIDDLTQNGPDVRLAVSITTADPMLRAQLMPISKTNALPALKESLIAFQKRNKKRITLEAVLLGGMGQEKSLDQLKEFTRGLDVILNVIPWNPVEGLELKQPTASEIRFFLQGMEKRGMKTTRRYERGQKISSACGQLGGIQPDTD